MSTLQEFLIKNTGMEKEARTALAKRLLAATLSPDAVIKRFGKVKGQQYLDDIAESAKNYTSIGAGNSQLKKIRGVIKNLKPGDKVPGREVYAPGVKTTIGKADLENLLSSNGISYNPDMLRHDQYLLGMPVTMLNSRNVSDLTRKNILRASTQLPITDSNRIAAQVAAMKEALTSANAFATDYLGNKNIPRSIKKLLDTVNGQNVLQPGTQANRLFNKVYNNLSLRNKLKLQELQEFVDGQDSVYVHDWNTILSSPKLGKGVEAHEKGHMLAHTLPVEQHADEAFRTFRKMQLLGDKHGLRVPLNNTKLMEEVFAQSYVPKLLGPNAGAARFRKLPTKADVNNRVDVTTRNMPKAMARSYREQAMSNWKALMDKYNRNLKAIDGMKASPDDKDLFKQLLLNYNHVFLS